MSRLRTGQCKQGLLALGHRGASVFLVPALGDGGGGLVALSVTTPLRGECSALSGLHVKGVLPG